MANELEIKKEGLIIDSVKDNQLGKVIKPLIKEIFLFDTYVAGTSYIDKDILKKLKIGEKLILQRENNRYDSEAIIIKTEQKVKIGYIPEEDNKIFSRLMDAGKLLNGKIESINLKGDWYKISIKIYLLDV